jgi:hypothetical protein
MYRMGVQERPDDQLLPLCRSGVVSSIPILHPKCFSRGGDYEPYSHRALDDAHTDQLIFFAMMEGLKEFKRPLDDYVGIYNSPVWPNDGIQLRTERGEAIYSQKKLLIRYVDGENQQTERWSRPSR